MLTEPVVIFGVDSALENSKSNRKLMHTASTAECYIKEFNLAQLISFTDHLECFIVPIS